MTSLPPSLLLLFELPAGPFWSPPRGLTYARVAYKKNVWLKGSDLKTIKYAAGVFKKLKDFLSVEFQPLSCPFEKACFNYNKMCVFTLDY